MLRRTKIAKPIRARRLAAGVASRCMIVPDGSFATETPVSINPVDRQLGEDCWLVNPVDHKQSEGFRDYRCQFHSYDDHKGTDLAISDLEEMAQGDAVIASVPATRWRPRHAAWYG